MAGEPVIQTQELSKVYGHPLFTWKYRVPALVDLTMQVNRGEVFGLLGPNGSGKTTTIKLLLGLLFPTAGRVAVFGRRPEDPYVKERLGFLPEESYLYRFLSAEETLDFYGRLFGLGKNERAHRVESLLSLVGLYRERARMIGEFSKGMQRRIGIAQALINDPELIILDEPTTGLDPLGTREIKDLILRLREKGKTVILSSHLLADVEDVCDRVVILYGGTVQAMGPVRELLQQESLTQVTAEMKPETVEAVARLIREREGERAITGIGPPTERLERFFLRVVEEATHRSVATSGVVATGGELDFLTEGAREEALIDRLAQGEETPPAQAPEQPLAPTPSAPAADMIENLVAGKQEPGPGAEAPPSSDEPRKASGDVLRRLVTGEEGAGADGEETPPDEQPGPPPPSVT